MNGSPWPRARTAATLAARLVLGVVFGLAAASKITALGIFRADVASYHMLPGPLVAPFAYALPFVEALLALYLILGLFLRFTAVVTALLTVVFIVALSHSIAVGNVSHSCGCLPTTGPIGSLPGVTWLAGGATIGWFDVARDGVFVLLAAAIYWGDRSTLSLDGALFGPPSAHDGDDDAAETTLRAGQAQPHIAPLPRTGRRAGSERVPPTG